MRRILIALLVLPAIAGAQTASLTPPLVALPMPAPAITVTAGQNVTLSWGVVTQSTTGQPLVGAVTYNLWEVSTGTAVLKASGLVAPTDERLSLAVGTPCYVATASVVGGIDSVGSAPPYCINVIAAPAQAGAPGVMTGVVTP